MKWLRTGVAVIVSALLLTTASGAKLGAGTSSSSSCTPGALASAFSGPLALQSIDSFGCSGAFGYVWATIGTGPAQISVTEVLHFDSQSQRWVFLSRQEYCTPGRLPTMVYRKGCFSN